MNNHVFRSIQAVLHYMKLYGVERRRSQLPFVLWLSAIVVFCTPVLAVVQQVVPRTVPAAVANLQPTGSLPGATNLNLAIVLPVRNRPQLNNLLQQIYDPASPNYRHYLTPEQFTELFGPTVQDYQAVINYAQTQGFTIVATHPNRVVLDVAGPVNLIEQAFHVALQVYQHPAKNRTFYSANIDPTLFLAVPVLSIEGLDNYAPPHPQSRMQPTNQTGTVTPGSGSGPGGTYRGNDFRAAYVPNTSLTGAGQNIGLLQFDGYNPSDIASYLSQAGIVTSVILTNIPIDGGISTPGSNNVEVCLDIEMAIAMAPGVSKIFVYEAPNPSPWVDLLNRMANDNHAQQLSCSWGGGPPDVAAEQIFLQMAAQGQSFFNASGDTDAFTGAIPFPSDSPHIVQVGGTTLSTAGPAGSYVSETVWNWGLVHSNYVGSSGGISTSYSIPSWQQGLSMSANHGSTTMRNVPDVALVADNIAIVADNGLQETVGGTSCAAPLWAAFTALVNQQAAANGQPAVGMLNPALYAIGKGTGYPADFHDITTGDNTWSNSPAQFFAVTGYDLCTGWGTPTVNLINALVSSAATGSVPNLPTTQPAQHLFDITRTSLYWFTHGYTNDPASTTLEQAIAINGGTLSLGFLKLPTADYTSGNNPALDTTMEALGFYYNGTGLTGDRGTASALCHARKLMIPELIAAIANNVLLGTGPENASYKYGGVITNFPPDLINQAGLAVAGVDVAQIQTLTALLHKFNASGVTNNFYTPLGQIECSPNPRPFLRKIARDATTYYNCPGLNDSCATAEVLSYPQSDNPFVLAKIQRTLDTRKLASGTGYWEITPLLGTTGAQFTVNTSKSNFETMLTVLKGECTVIASNGTTVVDSSGLTVVAASSTSTNSNSTSGAKVSFTTDGTNNFYIEAAPALTNTTGKLKFTLTSP